MGRYRLGDIVRMTRKSLSITQEQLSDEICSVETLSRIENGSQNPSRDVYELLMERMGRIRDRAYSLLSVSDLKVLEQMKLFEDYIKQYDFIQAEAVLKQIKQSVGSSILDKQFIIRAESIVNYYQKRITAEEYLEASEKAIRLTIPKYGSISLSNWPLSFNEAQLLINISLVYADKKKYQCAINVIKDAYSAMKQSYMEEQQRAILQVSIANNLSKFYGLNGNHEEAIAIANEGIQICKKSKLGNALPNLLYGVAWNKEQLIDIGVLSVDFKNECLSYFKQAYYIATAMRLSIIKQLIKDHIMQHYKKTCELIED
jgi:transcriptional regulator with XRE-family HTH domain